MDEDKTMKRKMVGFEPDDHTRIANLSQLIKVTRGSKISIPQTAMEGVALLEEQVKRQAEEKL